MERGDLQRLSKDELIDLVLRLQRPEKTSRCTPAVKAALRERCFRPENSAYGQEYAQSL